MNTYNVLFKGYRREENIDNMPEYGGIYMAYRCVYNIEKSTVSLKEIIYIGKTDNLKKSLLKHKEEKDLKTFLLHNEQICYSYANVPQEQADVVENALVYLQQPRGNNTVEDVRMKGNFKFHDAVFRIEGKCSLLKYTYFKIS